MKPDDYCGPFWGWPELQDCRACAFVQGAAVAFGLMGMAEAIRRRCTCEGTLSWADACERCKGYP